MIFEMKKVGHRSLEFLKYMRSAYLNIEIKKTKGACYFFGGYHYLVLSLFFALCDFFGLKISFAYSKPRLTITKE
jgi:hypothetical protein